MTAVCRPSAWAGVDLRRLDLHRAFRMGAHERKGCNGRESRKGCADQSLKRAWDSPWISLDPESIAADGSSTQTRFHTVP